MEDATRLVENVRVGEIKEYIVSNFESVGVVFDGIACGRYNVFARFAEDGRITRVVVDLAGESQQNVRQNSGEN